MHTCTIMYAFLDPAWDGGQQMLTTICPPWCHSQSLPPPPTPTGTKSSQTKEAISFRAALRQLQMVTQAKSQLEQELLLKWEELAQKQENQQARMVKKQEDQWARMANKQEDQWARMVE